MIILDHEQGSPAWYDARGVIATASEFSNVMTPKQLKRAKSDYIYRLAAYYLGERSQQFSTVHTERGNEQEDEAVGSYEFDTGFTVDRVGLCLPFGGARCGFSPDGLITAEKGGIEIKCPELKKHLQYLSDGIVPGDYISQVYGSLWMSDYDWWDFMSYHRKAKDFVIRTTKDDEKYLKWVAAFEPILNDFIADLDKLLEESK